jgi:hypothetical protein
MIPTRRKLLLAGAALLPMAAFAKTAEKPGGASTSFPAPKAPPKTGYTIVEIANFQCTRCAGVNTQYSRLRDEAGKKKIDLLFSPAAWQGQSLWPDRVYYAARDLYPRAQDVVRDAIFKGIHQQGQPFEALVQVRAYFEHEKIIEAAQKADKAFDWKQVEAKANSDDPLWAEVRVSKLIDLAFVTQTPAFLWLGDGQLYKAVNPKAVDTAGEVVNLVLQQIAAT